MNLLWGNHFLVLFWPANFITQTCDLIYITLTRFWVRRAVFIKVNLLWNMKQCRLVSEDLATSIFRTQQGVFLKFLIIRNDGNCLPIGTGSYIIPEDLSILWTLTTAEYFCSAMHPWGHWPVKSGHYIVVSTAVPSRRGGLMTWHSREKCVNDILRWFL